MASVDVAVLRSARALLAERGYRAMSVGDIARMAGVSKPTIYLRYASKRKLAQAALEGLSWDGDRVLPPREGSVSVRECLKRFAKECERINASGLVAAAVLERRDFPELLDAVAQSLIGPWSSAIRGMMGTELRLKSGVRASMALGVFFAADIVDRQGDRWLGYATTILQPPKLRRAARARRPKSKLRRG